jgi:crotonobetainyl-CoA:carnitine CoA-transferase CaiB-like acyl-CoA transferase
VNELDQAMDSAFLARTGMVQAAPHPDRSDMRVLSSPIRLDGERLPVRAAPLLGADSDDILASLGYDEGSVARLRQDGIV